MLNKVQISYGALYGCNIVLNADLFCHLYHLNQLRYLARLTSLHQFSVDKYYPTLYTKCDNHNCLFRSFVTFSNLCFRDQRYVLFLRCIILLLVQRNPSPFLMKRDIFYVSKTFVGETWESYPVKIQGMYSNFVAVPPSS